MIISLINSFDEIKIYLFIYRIKFIFIHGFSSSFNLYYIRIAGRDRREEIFSHLVKFQDPSNMFIISIIIFLTHREYIHYQHKIIYNLFLNRNGGRI